MAGLTISGAFFEGLSKHLDRIGKNDVVRLRLDRDEAYETLHIEVTRPTGRVWTRRVKEPRDDR